MAEITNDRATLHTFLDNSDVRYADTTNFLGLDLLYGVDVNNNPTDQDVWNTTSAWGFPYIASSVAPQFAPPGTLIEGGLAGKVVGTGVYTFWNDMLYAAAELVVSAGNFVKLLQHRRGLQSFR